MNQAHIDIFSDPVCPWCLVGLTRLNNVLARLSKNIEVGIIHHPFLLDANTPSKGEDVVAMLKRKYGKVPDEMWDRLELAAKESGLALNMRKQKWRYPSQKALVLIKAAKDKGTQHALALAMSHACYMEGLNIADNGVLKNIALKNGLKTNEIDRLLSDDVAVAEIEKDARGASQAGITGVPFFIFNNKFSLSGAQPEEVFEAAMDKALSMERIEG